MKIMLLLDLDGVLITTPSWRPEELETDGYSKFNASCIKNLNTLLERQDVEIWLSSTRRIKKTQKEFNSIFKLRNIAVPIKGFLPVCKECHSRKEEIERFIGNRNPNTFLILDDDKSLHGLSKQLKSRLVLTEFQLGFTQEKLRQAMQILQA